MITRRQFGLGLCGARFLWAQDEPVFTADAKDIAVDTAVMRRQRPFRGLRATDFVLYENGQPQAIRAITPEELPLDLVLIFDVVPGPILFPSDDVPKQSMAYADVARARLLNGAANVLLQIRPEDRVAFLTHTLPPRIELPFTSDRNTIGAALRSMGTLKYQAGFSELVTIEYAVRMLAELGSAPGRRRVIVRLGTSLGGPVPYADEAIIRRLWMENVIYSYIDIVFPGSKVASDGPIGPSSIEPVAALYRMMNPFHVADATGGDGLKFLDPKDPLDLLTPMRQRYVLWFRQPDGAVAGEKRKISVELAPEVRARYPDAVVKARSGYVTR